MITNTSLKELMILIVILFMIILLASYYKKRRYRPINIENLQKSLPAFLKYLDNYYIGNKLYTSFAFSLFCFSTIIIFIFLRYFSLGEIRNLFYLNPIDNLFYIFFSLMIKGIIFLLCIVLYKMILEILFYKEVLKVHLYLMKYEIYIRLQYAMNFKINDYIFGNLWILCYRIATKTYDPDRFNKAFEEWFEELIYSNELSYNVTNNYLKSIALKLMEMSNKYSFISFIFYLLAHMLKFLHWHNSNGLFKLLPYTIILLTFLYDLYHRELYYIYYFSFIFIILRLIISYRNFVRQSDINVLCIIAAYFYKNTLPYNEQRFYILNYQTYLLKKTSKENTDLAFRKIDPLMLINDFKKSPMIEPTSEDKLDEKRIKYMNIRFYIFLVLIIMALNLILCNNIRIECFFQVILFIIIIPLLVILYCMTKIFYREINKKYTGDEWYSYHYNRKFTLIFLLMALIQIYVFWILLLKPQLIFMKTEIIFDYIITISSIYTVEEKVMYLYQYFDIHMQSTLLSIDQQELLRYKLRQINFKELIDETTTLKEIIYKVKDFISEEHYKNIILTTNKLIELYSEPNGLYSLIRNTLIIAGTSVGIMNTVSYYGHFMTVLAQLQDPYQIYLIANEMKESTLGALHDRFFIYLFRIFKDKFPSCFDIFIYYGIEYIPLQIRIIFISIFSALLGAFILPNIIDSFEKPLIKETKIYVTFLDDMSTIPIIAPYNCYYTIAILSLLISMYLIIKKTKKQKDKRSKYKPQDNH